MDESGIKTKTKRDGRMQRNIAKPARYFLKVFGLAASGNVPALRGYIYRASLYGGKGDVDSGELAGDPDDDGDGGACPTHASLSCACLTSLYPLCVRVCAHADEDADARESEDAGAKVSYVMRLVNSIAELQYNGHILYCDNYYGSEALLKALSELGIHSVMTVNASAVRCGVALVCR